ncbi:MAG: hypothetical protein CMN76_18430 [Spirochaetaceae bacterium]|nr:hypothetical protein [Spirochaetaceae bacterium]|tara:strand:+ start:272492 stop:274516 length:2025 start_codon:yes stop_codon:yes gene_type:complete
MEPTAESQSSQSPDLISSTDLKSLLLSFSPGAEREITQVEKGVQNFFMFHQSPRALVKIQELKILSETDLKNLEDREVLRIGHYLEYSDEEQRLVLQKVAVRPASLKGEQVDTILRACVRTGLSSVLRYIRHRDLRVLEQERQGELGPQLKEHLLMKQDVLLERTAFVQQLGRLESCAFESLLESETGAPREYLAEIIRHLARPQEDLRGELELEKEKFKEAYEILDQRPERPVLFALRRDFHVIYPPGFAMVDFEEDSFTERVTEIEWIHRIFVDVAARIIKFLMPDIEVEKGELGTGYHTELARHPSFTAGESWPGGMEFLEAFGKLIQLAQGLRSMRAEVLLGFVYQQTLKMLNMKFEPIYFDRESFQPPEQVAQKFSDKKKIFESVLSNFKKDPEVLVSLDKRSAPAEASGAPSGAYLLFRSNLPRSFIRNKDRRSFLHMMAKEGGMSGGIYDALIDMNMPGLDTDVLSEQRELTEAIKKWEEELEKERKKKAKKGRGFFARLLDWFLALFGMSGAPARKGSAYEDPAGAIEQDDFESEPDKKRKKKTGGRSGPRARTHLVPPNVSKAVSYVERANNGLIWLDEVVKALNSVKFDMNNTGDLLYYDQQDRFDEMRPLMKHRRVFIRKDNLEKPDWLLNTAAWLENMTNRKEEHSILAQHLRHRASDLGDY